MYSKAENFPGEVVSDGKGQKVSANQTNDGQKPAAIFPRIAATDMTAVRECIEAHGNLVWSLAKKLTGSNEEAETATQEIFLALWKSADRFDRTKCSEETFVFLIAYRCMTKGKEKSVPGADEVVF